MPLVRCLALTVRPGKALDVPHVEPGLGVPLDDSRVALHFEASSLSEPAIADSRYLLHMRVDLILW